MDAKDALELADRLVYDQTGKYLGDLERAVFVGSWEGRTYEDIHPENPEYVEKYVSYKLWQKLSIVLGEKVTKKKLRGALERALQTGTLVTAQAHPRSQFVLPGLRQRVFISHRPQDALLAQQFYEAIVAAGHEALMADRTAGERSAETNRDWLAQLNTALQQCDYFLLLLSPEAAVSEMVIEELQRIKERYTTDRASRPVLLPIRIHCAPDLWLNHDLRNYLQDAPQQIWRSPADTPRLVQAVLNCLNGQGSWRQEVREPLPLAAASTAQLPTPTPVADPELPQGQVRLDSAFYIERMPYEAQCYREILQPGTLIRIKAPRQMGKTSLMSRILSQAREQGYRTVPLSFQHADVGIFASLNPLLQWFCSKITRKLRLPHQVDQYWTDTFGSKDNCTAYFEDCLLSELDSPLVLGLDEVDRIFQYPKIADDFFGLLRAWYEEAGYGDSGSGLWEKLRLVVVHSTEVYIPLDVNQSPFNVGLPIELSEFSREQVCDLAQRHRLPWQRSEVDHLMQMVGGHPYLVRLALYHLAQQHLTLTQLVDLAPTEAGIYGDHLRRHLWNLQQHPDLAIAFSRVLASPTPVELESLLAFKLHSLGLVHLQGNEITPRFELYRQYFAERLPVSSA